MRRRGRQEGFGCASWACRPAADTRLPEGMVSAPALLVVLSMETWPGRVPALPVVVAPRELEPPVVLRRPLVAARGWAELVVSPCSAACSKLNATIVRHAVQAQQASSCRADMPFACLQVQAEPTQLQV